MAEKLAGPAAPGLLPFWPQPQERQVGGDTGLRAQALALGQAENLQVPAKAQGGALTW